ncbi:hypothetical protein SDC9_150647 [bioreactor metagenome]|uniref:Uncharacterized protein n=1 Tax=bioreactor metagenome TaxID=1076179 RepID=A0A645ENM8_9ZZZZ
MSIFKSFAILYVILFTEDIQLENTILPINNVEAIIEKTKVTIMILRIEIFFLFIIHNHPFLINTNKDIISASCLPS